MASSSKDLKHMQTVVDGLNKLRTEQRTFSQKVVELESDMNEHRLVIDVLKTVEPDRKCFRMIGGILVEQTVKDVLPDLGSNVDMLTKTVESFHEKVKTKANDINEYVKKHNLGSMLRAAQVGPSAEPATGPEPAKPEATKSDKASSVLV